MSYPSSMRAVAAALLAGALVACHLAESPQQSCDAGFHVDLGRCVPDPTNATGVTISAAGDASTCSVAPETVHVPAGALFHFVNQDTIDHDVHGADGQLWATVPKEQTGPDEAIDKVGSWPYTVSGCGKGGTIVVE